MGPPEGKACWIEIPVRHDMAKLKDFYAAAFPNWEWKPSVETEGVHLWISAKDGLGGGLVPMPPQCPKTEQTMGAGFTVYFFVDSIEEATARIEKIGGKTVLPKMEQGNGNFFSNMVDIEGNRFGLYVVGPDNM